MLVVLVVIVRCNLVIGGADEEETEEGDNEEEDLDLDEMMEDQDMPTLPWIKSRMRARVSETSSSGMSGITEMTDSDDDV